MDKELIAMCDCPEIQDNIFQPNEYTGITARDGSFPVEGDIVFLPSVSWLLREIEAGLTRWQEFQLHISSSDEHFALIVDVRRHYGDARSLIFSSRMQRDIRIALLHVLMGQKGKKWDADKKEWANA